MEQPLQATASIPPTGSQFSQQEETVNLHTKALEQILLRLERTPITSQMPATADFDLEAVWDNLDLMASTSTINRRDAIEVQLLKMLRPHYHEKTEAEQAYIRERLRILSIALKHGWGVAVFNANTEPMPGGLQVRFPQKQAQTIKKNPFYRGRARGRGRGAAKEETE